MAPSQVKAVKVLSVRVDDQAYAQIERARIEAGQSRTDWLRSVISHGVTIVTPHLPDPSAVQFCSHPADKRLDNFCVACGGEVG
jgi:Ribbon-helix-helix protein, copG family